MMMLKRQESVGTGLKRIACEYVEVGVRALARQGAATSSPGESVGHASAVLALLEQHLPRKTARRAQSLFEQIHSALEPIDQPAAMFARLNVHFKKAPADADLASEVKALRKRWSADHGTERALNSRGGNFDPGIYRLVADMAELRGHAGEWPIDAVPDDAPPAGLRRTYAKARRLAQQPDANAQLAELANTLGQLRDQLTLLTKACPLMLKAHRKLLDRVLGPLEDHLADAALDDLLCQSLDKPAGWALPDATATPERLNTLLGANLHAALAETPSAFHNRMQTYWTAWRG